MKAFILSFFCFFAFSACKHTSLDEVKSYANRAFNKSGLISQSEMSLAFKQALKQGAKAGVLKLSANNAFFNNPSVKIPFPPDARQLESSLRGVGLSSICDDFHRSMNKAAEKAVAKAMPIFSQAIMSLSFQDTLSMLKGNDNAITEYLKQKTASHLMSAFKPIVSQNLENVSATKYWKHMTQAYNRLPLSQSISTDLTSFVTSKAIQGLFMQIAKEEHKIRKNPGARTTALMQKVFSQQ